VIVATFDANVLLSGFTSRQGTPAQLLLRWINRVFDMALSEYIINEVAYTFERPYFAARLTVSERAADIAVLRSLATIVVPELGVRGVSRDPKDDPVLGTAVAANAAYLVTGDADLLALGRYGVVAIVAPRPFLTLLDLVNEAVEESELAADG
jgi:putative PIN family toxin of toxin-antitoxin system